MNWVLYALLTVTSILRCCLLFELGRMIYENIIMIRGIDEKIDNTTREIKKVEAEIKKIETKEIRNEWRTF